MGTKKKKQKEKGSTVLKKKLVDIYVFFMVGLFPLLMNHGFADITKAKSDIFLIATVIFSCFSLAICLGDADWSWISKKRNWLIYSAIVVIGVTTVFAWNSQYALTGECGRYHGAIVYWAYCAAALCIINFGSFNNIVLDVLIGTGFISGVIAVLNFYEIDVLGTLEIIVDHQKHAFISTLGNINIFAAYLSIVTPVAVVKAINEENKKKRIFYYSAIVCMFAAMMACISDSVYITLIVIGAILPFFYLSDSEKRKRLVWMLVLFTGTLLTMNIMNQKLEYPLIYVDGILRHFSNRNLCIVLFIISIVVTISCKIFDKTFAKLTEKQWRILWGSLCGVFAVLFICFYASRAVFDGTWGSYRGIIWKEGWMFFTNQEPLRKIFGIGLDSVYPAFYEFWGAGEFAANKPALYDNVHNEYLQYLITTGFVGVALYLFIMGTILYNLFRKAKENDVVLAVAMAGVCYMAQAVVNINMSSVTAIIMVLLFAGLTINEK